MIKSIKKYKAVDFWTRLLENDLSSIFSIDLSETNKKSIFKKFVEVVNLETSTYCNRHCGYCPLSNDNRGGYKA